MLDTVVSPPKMIDNSSASEEKQILKVFYKDNTFKSYNLQADVQAVEVCSKFASKFLRISERAASHFSLHLVIQGKVVKQLKPSDKPIKIQKELCTLGYKFNTTENENYFLFCLNEETKSKMNDYCERNSVMLGSRVLDPTKSDASKTQVAAVSPQRSMLVRTQSVITSFKPTILAKEKFTAFKKRIKRDTVADKSTPSPSPSPSPSPTPSPSQDETKGTKPRRGTAPPQLSPQPVTAPVSALPSTPSAPSIQLSHSRQPSTPLQTPTFEASTPQSTPEHASSDTTVGRSTPEPIRKNNSNNPDPHAPLPPSLSQSWSPESTTSPPRQSVLLAPRNNMPPPPSPKPFSPPSSPFHGGPKTAGEDLENVISSIFDSSKPSADTDDVSKMMDNLFDWYSTSSTTIPPTTTPTNSLTQSPQQSTQFSTQHSVQSHSGSIPATAYVALPPPPSPSPSPSIQASNDTLDSDDEFNEILDALSQLSKA